jgi:hypothetical protein
MDYNFVWNFSKGSQFITMPDLKKRKHRLLILLIPKDAEYNCVPSTKNCLGSTFATVPENPLSAFCQFSNTSLNQQLSKEQNVLW